jgi:hypothetical protein
MGELQFPLCRIGDDDIELYALGRVRDPDPELVAHFLECDACAERIEKARTFAGEIKRALAERESGSHAGSAGKRHKHASGF